MKLKREVRATRGLIGSQKLVFCHKIQVLDACRHKMSGRSKKKLISEIESVESCVLTLVTIVCRLVVQSRSLGHMRVFLFTQRKQTNTLVLV